MILVSACLLGYKYRFDGDENSIPELISVLEGKDVKAICPEVDGGLSIPRPPAEIINGSGQEVLAGKAAVRTIEGEDVTSFYLSGSRKMLANIDPDEVEFAVLKARSPSCGSKQIYNGEFNGQLKAGSGVGAAYLHKQGIKVFSEEELDKIKEYIEEIK